MGELYNGQSRGRVITKPEGIKLKSIGQSSPRAEQAKPLRLSYTTKPIMVQRMVPTGQPGRWSLRITHHGGDICPEVFSCNLHHCQSLKYNIVYTITSICQQNIVKLQFQALCRIHAYSPIQCIQSQIQNMTHGQQSTSHAQIHNMVYTPKVQEQLQNQGICTRIKSLKMT